MTEQTPTPSPPDERPKPGAEAVVAAARGDKLRPDQVSDATAWFLEESPEEVATKTFEINLGQFADKDGGGRELHDRYLPWTVRAVDRDRIRQLRMLTVPRRERARGRGGEENDMEVNLRIAAEGTIDPDLGRVADQLEIRDADPNARLAGVLKRKLRHKPGLIDQIAGEVLTVSGYDDEDIREVRAAEN